VLTLVALLSGLVFGFRAAVPVVAGMAAAQLILAGSAVVESVRG
jgi:threonine/homoserine/homoserine lactone efflux protein